jgi:thiol-disulfide isomerase/thioredoxin
LNKNQFMKNIVFVILLSITLFSCQNNEKKGGHNFSIKGNIKGLADGKKILLFARNYDNGQADSLTATVSKNGAFVLEGNIPNADIYYMGIEGKEGAIELVLEQKEMTLSGDINDLKAIQLNGSKGQDDFVALSEQVQAVYATENIIYPQLEKAQENEDKKAVDSLGKELESIYLKAGEVVKKYAIDHPTALAAPYMILNTIFDLDAAEYQPIFNKFSDEVKNTQAGKILKDKLIVLSKTAVGNMAVDIQGLDPDGKNISLMEIKGKVTLIDFWASWCGPCRKENPNVVKMYNKYHAKGFEILSVSLDEKAESWKAAIMKDGLIWHHVSDLKGWKSDYATAYGIQAIPQTILLDSEGKIIGRNVMGEELDNMLMELLK